MKRLFMRTLLTMTTLMQIAMSSDFLAASPVECEGDPMTREEALQRLNAAGTKVLLIGTAHEGTHYKSSGIYSSSTYPYDIWLVVDDYGDPYFKVFSAYSYKLPAVNGDFSRNIRLFLPSRNGSYNFSGFLKNNCLLLTAEGIREEEEVIMYGRIDN